MNNPRVCLECKDNPRGVLLSYSYVPCESCAVTRKWKRGVVDRATPIFGYVPPAVSEGDDDD